MVIMSARMYEEKQYMYNVYSKLEEAEAQIAEGKTMDADESLAILRAEFDV